MQPGTVLGFDVGSRVVGVAIASAFSDGARELAVLEVGAGGLDWSRLQALVAEWQPQALVVGDPLQLDPEAPDQPARRRARAFARQARQRTGLPVYLVDERHSSQEAARRFAAGRAGGVRRRRDAARIDALAAAVILERWLMQPETATEVDAP